MNTPNVGAGRLERRVRLVGRETMPGNHGFCSFFPFGAIREVPLLRRVNVGFGRWQTPSSCLSRITPQGGYIRATLANPYPTGTFTRQETPSLAWRTNKKTVPDLPGYRRRMRRRRRRIIRE